MRACPNCSELADDSANFCHMCGERLLDEPPPPPVPIPSALPEPETSRSTILLRVLVPLIAVLVLGVGAAVVLSDSGDEGGSVPTPSPTSPSPTASPSPSILAAPPADVLASTQTVRIRLQVSNCPGCEITAIPADSTAAQTATVAQDSVQYALPAPSTLGLSFTVAHPDGFGSANGPNAVVLAPAGKQPGASVTVGEVIDAGAASLCWAGAVESDATIPIVVEPFADGTPIGGLRAWAHPAQPVLSASAVPAADGTVEAADLLGCVDARAELVG